MRKADDTVEIWVGSKYLEGIGGLHFLEKVGYIRALGELTDLGIDSNLHRKKRYKRDMYEVS